MIASSDRQPPLSGYHLPISFDILKYSRFILDDRQFRSSALSGYHFH